MVTPDTPQRAAAAIRPRPHASVAIVGPPGSGKTTALAHVVQAAITRGLCLPAIAVFAASRVAARCLIGRIVEAWPDLERRDLHNPGQTGIPIDAASAHSWVRHERVADRRDHERAAEAFCELIKVVGGIGDDLAGQAFLSERRADIVEAIRFDVDSRLRGKPLPRIAWLHEIADFFRAYKVREELADEADLHRGAICGDDQVELLVMDEISDRDRAMLKRCFPRAGTVTSSRTPIAADQVIELTHVLRQPERLDIVDETGMPSLVPVEAVEGTLMIITSRGAKWRMPGWRRWCDEAGYHTRLGSLGERDSWQAVVGVWNIDSGGDTNACEVVPLLRAAGLEPYFDEGMQLGRADIPGFTDWREVASHGDPRELVRAEAVLARYGRLLDLPDHRIVTAKQARGREADTVIVDRFSGIFADDDLATAMSRARRKLIVVRKP